MFCSPVIYSSRLVPPEHRGWYAINPMMGVIEGFRWVFLGTEPTGTGPAPVALGLVALLVVSGLIHFRLLERSFADVI
jgi:lipopolysaccharide transport system permease protein